MQKLIMAALVGGAVYWLFLRPKQVVPPVQQARLTTTSSPAQMQVSPGMSGPELYNVEAFPMGSFAN